MNVVEAPNYPTLETSDGYEAALEKLEVSKSILFSLADELLSRDKSDWNVLIGDDASGRLPTRFLRKVLASEGLDLPTFYVAGSAALRLSMGEAPYEEYFSRIESLIGQPLRPLLITETLNTGSTLDFLRKTMAPHIQDDFEPEVAVVACNNRSHIQADYIGGVGNKAICDVWYSFEGLPRLGLRERVLLKAKKFVPEIVRDSIKSKTKYRIVDFKHRPNELAGIVTDSNSILPVAKRDPLRSEELVAGASKVIDEFVNEYVARRKRMKMVDAA